MPKVDGGSDAGDAADDAGATEESEKPQAVHVKQNYVKLITIFLCYMATGAAVYTAEEDWTFIDCLYFGVVTITTVGYGDLSPAKDSTKIFTVFYAFIGIGFLSVVLQKLARRLLDAQSKSAAQHREAMARNIEASTAAMAASKKNGGVSAVQLAGQVSTKTTFTLLALPKCLTKTALRFAPRCLKFHMRNMSVVAMSMLPLMLFIGFFAMCVALIEKDQQDLQDPITALYFSFITVTSIGYGDYSPQTQEGRLFAFIFIPFGVTLLAKAVASIMVGTVANKHQSRAVMLRKLRHVKARTPGFVDEAEYLEYMLVSLGRVDGRTMYVLRKQFTALCDGSERKIDLEKLREQAGVKPEPASKAVAGRGSRAATTRRTVV